MRAMGTDKSMVISASDGRGGAVRRGRRGGRVRGMLLAVLFAAAVLGLGLSQAAAQDNPFEASTGEKSESKLSDFEKKQVERKSIAEEEGGEGPKLERESTSVRQWERSKLQYQDKAIKLMEATLKDTDPADAEYPLLLERLSDMYWQKATYHELNANDKLQDSYRAAEAGNATAEAEAKRAYEAESEEARVYREKTVGVYKRLVDEYPLYEDADRVLFYLAFNLQEMGQLEDSNKYYKQLVRDYPATKYQADAYLGLAEYAYIVDEDMSGAMKNYDLTIAAAPNSDAAGYAMYKKGWCFFNLGEPEKALAQFESVIEFAGGDSSRAMLRSEATKELVKAYSQWEQGKASNAKKYLSKFSGGDAAELNEMMERLARLYQEDGQIDKSNYVYNQLIGDNATSFKVVGYQIEIMLNTETQNIPDKTAEEIIRTVQLFNLAKSKGMADHTPEREQEYYSLLEEYTRETAKWYHLTAQTTKNPLYYALAYEIYKAYVDNFPEAQDNYEMMYYYAELLYWKKNWPEAAKRYDQVLDIDESGKFSQDAAYGAVLAYNRMTEVASAECPVIPMTPEPAPGEEPTFPAFDIPDCRLRLVAAADRFARLVPEDTPAGEHLVDIKYTAARIFYEYNQFDKAIERFEDIAMNHSSHRLAVVSANLMLDSLSIGRDYEKMWAWVVKFKSVPELNRPPLDEVLEALELQLAFKFCQDKEGEKAWAEAATCYEEYATNYPSSEYSPKALWNASVDWENASEIGKAIETRIRLLREHGDDELLAPRALYAIGQNYHGIAVYSEAARFYELFVDKYPKNDTACVPDDQVSDVPCSMLALQNAAAFRGGLGQYEEAVANYDRYAAMFPRDAEQISLLKFNTGRIYLDQGQYDKAIERFEEYLQRHAKLGPRSREIAAHTAIGRAYWRKNARGAALKQFEKAEDKFNAKGFQAWLDSAEERFKQEAAEAAAEARFMRGEAVFREAMAIQLTDETVEPRKAEEHMVRQLEKKAKLMLEAEPIYSEVITRFRSPKWGLAAMARLGMMYHDVAHQVENSPCPPRLTEEQCLYYEDGLLTFASQFEDKAVGFYVSAITTAAELGWFNDYTTLAQRRLFDLRPDEYRSASEIKAQPNQALVSWHRAGIYDDVEAAEGKKEKKRRGPIDLQDRELQNVKGEGGQTSDAQR